MSEATTQQPLADQLRRMAANAYSDAAKLFTESASEIASLTDAYCGAREDLAIWKRRALEAEEKLRAESTVSARLVSELNAQNGPTHMSDVGQAQLASMLANHQPMPLVVAPDGSELAACFDQIKSELIADGAVEHDLGLEFFPEAVLDAFRRQRAARQEAQQRLADAQELLAKSGLAHRKAVQAAVSDAMKRMQAGEKLGYTDKEVELIMLGWQSELQKAVAAEREACVKFVRSFDTAMTDKIANELLLARGAA